MNRVWIAWGALSLLTAGAAPAPGSLRCKGRLIHAGDESVLVLQLCGKPLHQTSRPVLNAQSIGTESAAAASATREVVEDWTYRGEGANALKVVQIRRGRVASIRTAVLPAASSFANACDRGVLPKGTSQGEVKLRCGAPLSHSTWVEERLVASKPSENSNTVVSEAQLIQHARWIYDTEPGRFYQVYHFENGRLVSVQSGSRKVK